MAIIDSAELLLQAKNYSGSGDWLDEANAHDAQLGSTSGADTNDPAFDVDHFDLTTNDYFLIGDDAGLDFAAAESMTAMIAYRLTSVPPAASVSFFDKRDPGDYHGYLVYTDGSNVRALLTSAEGSAYNETPLVGASGELSTVAIRVDRTAEEIECFAGGSESANFPTDTTGYGTLDNTGDLLVGAFLGGGSGFHEGTIVAFALWRSALSDADIATAHAELVATTAVETVIRPIADTAGTGWDTAPTASQSLYAQVDEVTASDTDYIYTTDPNP